MLNKCPKCLKDDQVQKVSAIVASGTYSTTYQVPAQGEIAGHKIYGTVQQTGTGKTELAQTLSMPTEKEWNEWKDKQLSQDEIVKEFKRLYPEPQGEKNYQLKVGCLILGFIGLGCGFLSLFAVGLNSPSDFNIGICLSCIPMSFFPLSWVVAKIIYEISNPKEHKDKFSEWSKSKVRFINEQRTATQVKASAAQRQATANFNMLYYCYRDDLVFLPEKNFAVESKEMMSMATWFRLGQMP